MILDRMYLVIVYHVQISKLQIPQMILDRMYLVIVYHVQISKLQIPPDDSRQNVPGYCLSCTDIKTADTLR